ncbi:hypothetical protein RJ639_013263 [Escallonia herrerae]|uniref:Translation initiation factor 3 N-terminal domain-containing protein n=1 Tax=Escallonia herrerae TaxID=1293975 RepID=A0AA88VI57_9ASTE|nr:hypothetical protein RJ639_013263 [Escallonia herrerae]
MAFWCRIKKSHLKNFASDFKRCYFEIQAPSLLDHSAPHTSVRVLDKPNSALHCNQFALPNPSHVRFFAAPVQYLKPKKEEKDTTGPRLNEQITAWEVRLVTDGGHTIMSRKEALAQARKLDLDLVEVQRTADPPVCKIMDYHREKYKQQIKEKDKIKSKVEESCGDFTSQILSELSCLASRNNLEPLSSFYFGLKPEDIFVAGPQDCCVSCVRLWLLHSPETTLKKGPCKEVRFTFKINQDVMDFYLLSPLLSVKMFSQTGEASVIQADSVQIDCQITWETVAVKQIRFKLIEQKDLQMKAEMTKRLMDKGYRVKVFSFHSLRDVPMVTVFLILIEDVSVVESGPCVEPKQAYVIVRHAKFGPTKKGKASKISIPSPTANSLNQNHSELENSMDSGYHDSEAEDDISPEEAPPSPSLEMPGDPEITKSTWSVFDGSEDFEKVFDLNRGATSSSSQQNTFSEVMNKKPVLNSTAAHTGSPQMEAPLGNENRYKKNVGPNFPKQGRQPQFAPNSTRVPRGLDDHPIQSSPTDTNRYKKGANSNPPASKSDYRGRPDVNRGASNSG